jgi:hypothetical protein
MDNKRATTKSKYNEQHENWKDDQQHDGCELST